MENLLKKPSFWIALVVLVLLLGAAAHFYQSRYAQPVEPAREATLPAPVAPIPAPPVKTEEATKFPLPASPLTLADKTEADKDKANKLPPPDDSDSIMNDLLSSLIGSKAVATFFQNTNLVRRLTAAVDNLPREKLASRLNPLKPTEGRLATTGADDTLAISPGNYARYQPFVNFAVALDTKKIVDAYVRFYPLFQQEYQALGYPNKYFNDRVVEAIDDLLAAPELPVPAKLIQPKVQFQFADPALESLSHGKKAMIRIGPEHAAALKAKLREFRLAITKAQASKPKS
jgi:Protein of unknown function (DUF3014)